MTPIRETIPARLEASVSEDVQAAGADHHAGLEFPNAGLGIQADAVFIVAELQNGFLVQPGVTASDSAADVWREPMLDAELERDPRKVQITAGALVAGAHRRLEGRFRIAGRDIEQRLAADDAGTRQDRPAIVLLDIEAAS